MGNEQARNGKWPKESIKDQKHCLELACCHETYCWVCLEKLEVLRLIRAISLCCPSSNIILHFFSPLLSSFLFIPTSPLSSPPSYFPPFLNNALYFFAANQVYVFTNLTLPLAYPPNLLAGAKEQNVRGAVREGWDFPACQELKR